MDEWADKIRKITIEKWLKANPGKTEKDYEEYLREDEKRTRERKRREELQQEAEVKLGCLG
ncbi:MAG TPA: hypothetical protein VLA04_06780, partial [Verrucomicrobiae bacterium]|nr:hypothetical protein [Verrucomicrobiae bacterium]